MSQFVPVVLSLPPSLAPSLSLEVLPHGFTIHRFFVTVNGKTHDIVIGPEAPQDHVVQKYTNTIVGRYANRIPVGTHPLERNSFKSELTTYANEGTTVSLHGGPEGFDLRTWTQLAADEKPTLFSETEVAALASAPRTTYAIFRLVSPAGDQGYPGTLLTESLITVSESDKPSATDGSESVLGTVVLVYRAKLTDANTVTPVNLTQHWGFNLDATLEAGPTPVKVTGHKLTIKAESIAELDSSSLGTGKYLPVSELPAHQHDNKVIGDKIPEKGYDHYYLFKQDVLSCVPSRIPLADFTSGTDLLSDLLKPAANETEARSLIELSSDKTGLKLVFDSNQHGAMFYSNAWADPEKARKVIHGGSGLLNRGDGYGPQTAAFIEFHHPLAAFLYAENKNKEDTLVTSEEIYHNYVRLDVKFKQT